MRSPAAARCASRDSPGPSYSAAAAAVSNGPRSSTACPSLTAATTAPSLPSEPAHPSANLAAVLAVGDMIGAGGPAFITAAVLAYEIQCRLCDAASLRKHGIDHVTYGALSSAAAACK